MTSSPVEIPRSTVPPAARIIAFAAVTFAATAVGRSTFDESLGLSLVHPLHGLAVVWLASGSRATWGWDVAVMTAAVAVSVVADGGSWQQLLVATLLAAPVAGLWMVLMHRLVPDLRGAGGTRLLGRLSDLRAFLVASTVTAVVAAVVRSSGLGLLPPVTDVESVLLTAVRNLSWILGLGALGLLLLTLGSARRPPSMTARGQSSRPSLAWALEVLAVVAATSLVTAATFWTPSPLAFALVLSSVWAGFRLPTVVGVLMALALGTVAVLATLSGGAFRSAGSDYQSAALAQAFLITLVLTVLAISIDVRERQNAAERARVAEAEAEARARLFSAVIEHLDEGVTVITADDDYTVRNRAARRLTGVGGFLSPVSSDSRQPVMLGQDGIPLRVEEMPHSRARAEGRTVRQSVRVKFPAGAERFLDISSIPVPGMIGDERTVVVNTLRDTTQDHEERDQLVAFAGVVAHDLKNPLTVIGGWSESIQEELASDAPPDVAALRSMIDRVLSASGQMRSFIDDLLAMTVARDRPLQREALDLSALAEEVAELRRAGETQARIAVQPGMAVVGDRFLVRQLLDNLIGNAVKYVAPDVRPSITIEARASVDDLEVWITDNGIGIPTEARQRVFDTFVRAHTTGYTGTGLGLSICERVVTRHGGRIWVADRDAGTRVCFTLPRR